MEHELIARYILSLKSFFDMHITFFYMRIEVIISDFNICCKIANCYLKLKLLNYYILLFQNVTP
jgi:hypothetical protein